MAFILLLLLHHNPLTAVAVGLGWGAVPQGLAWGVAELVAPGWVIRWRQRLISGVEDWRTPVGDFFSNRFAIAGSEPWKNPTARGRLRILGAGLTAFWLLFVAALIQLPPHLDAFYAALARP